MEDAVKVFPVGFQKILEETTNIEFEQVSDSLASSLLATNQIG